LAWWAFLLVIAFREPMEAQCFNRVIRTAKNTLKGLVFRGEFNPKQEKYSIWINLYSVFNPNPEKQPVWINFSWKI